MFQFILEVQREIYLALADQIKAVAAGGGWASFLAFLPFGIVFGAVHAMTPGHSKTVLAAYVVGSERRVGRALLTSLVLSATHVSMAVLIAVAALPLVSVALGSVGRAPLLEGISRLLLAGIGIWMIVRAVKRQTHSHHEGKAFGVMAGLIPCPLTLFAMTFAMSRGVPLAGLLFAATMMIGVAATLGLVAALSVGLRSQLAGLLSSHPRALEVASRWTEGICGGMLLAICAWHFA